MLYQIGIKDGFAQIKGSGRHIKIISAATPLRIQAQDSDGRVLLDSKFRAPMATELPVAAAVINIYADEQTVELWYSNQPLDYSQNVVVFGGKLKVSTKFLYGGYTRVLERNPRTKAVIKSDEDIYLSGEIGGDLWPVSKDKAEEMETFSEIFALKNKDSEVVLSAMGDTTEITSDSNFMAASHVVRFKDVTICCNGVFGLKYYDGVSFTRLMPADLGLTKALYLTVFNSKVYLIGTITSNYLAVLVSEDGKNYTIIKESPFVVSANIISVSNSARTNKQSVILDGNAYLGADIFAVEINLETLEFAKHDMPAGETQWSLYKVDNDLLILRGGSSGGVKKIVAPGQFETIYQATSSVTAISGEHGLNPESGKIVAYRGGNVVEIDAQGVSNVSLHSIGTNYGKYLYVGVDCFINDSSISIYYGGKEYKKTLTTTGRTIYSNADKKLYGVKPSASVSESWYETPFAGSADNTPAVVKVLEYLF